MTKIAYETLTERAYDFIHAYSPDPLDLDDDGGNDTAGEATVANVSAGFSWLTNHPSIRSDSQVFIYICDHGSRATSTIPGRIWLNRSEFLEPTDIAGHVINLLQSTSIRPDNVIVFISCCFSGAFIPDVGNTGVICITSTADDEFGYAFNGSIWWDKRFFEEIQSGASLGSAFTRAVHTRQTQQIDASGNGVANEVVDQSIADGITIGLSATTPTSGPVIYTHTAARSTITALFTCKVMVFDNDISSVTIGSAPDGNTGDSYVVVPNQPMAQSQLGPPHWEADIQFTRKGVHHIFVSAENSYGYSTTETFEVNVENLLPTPRFSYSVYGDTGYVYFNASATVNATQYLWDFGDGCTASGVTCSHVFEPGEYYVKLRASNSYGAIVRPVILKIPGQEQEPEEHSRVATGGCSYSPGGKGNLFPLLLLTALLLILRRRKIPHQT
jgi:MYXO-CTERM domain-containing protein